MSNQKKIDPSKLAAELQKARFRGIPASEVVKKMQEEANRGSSEKKVDAAVDAAQTEGEPIKQNLLSKAKTFTQAVASKGLNGAKAPIETYSLRVLSCHGNEESGLVPCPRRMESKKFPGSYYCGACGCGDKPMTQLIPFTNNGKEVDYTKLHYPKVTCPLEMPGFYNYKTTNESPKTANSRKQFIEFNEGVEHIKEHSTTQKKE